MRPDHVMIRIPNPDRDDFESLREVDVEVFRYLVALLRHPLTERLTPREIGKGALHLHEETIVQALTELRIAGFIEAELVNT